MIDTDLQDDSLKLVRFTILFTKQGYECRIAQWEELVSARLAAMEYLSLKCGEFVQSLQLARIPVPAEWGSDYPPDVKDLNGKQLFREGDILRGLPPDDIKYINMHFEVLGRYPHEQITSAKPLPDPS